MRLLVTALSCAALAACGTTVPVAQQVGPGGAAAPVTSGPLGTGSVQTPEVGGIPGSGDGSGGTPGSATPDGASTGTSGSLAGGTGDTGGSTGSSTTTTGAGPTTTNGGGTFGQGLSATKVEVGITYDPNLDAANSTLAQGLGSPSSRDMNIAYKDMLNAKGGLSGHRIELDAFQVSATTTDDSAELARACSHFTTDHKVFSVFGGRGNPFAACLDKGGVLPISSNLTITTDADFRQAPHYFEPSTLDLDRRSRNLPKALADQGWLSKGATLGVVSYDQPGFRRSVDAELLPRLKELGFPVAPSNVVLVHYPGGYSDYGSLSSETASAVLRLRQAGVDHVVLLDAAGVMTLFFMQAAENQGYRPLYGLDTASGVQTLLEGGNISAAQAANVTGLGWVPGLDVPAAKVPKNPKSDSCLAFFRDKGFAATNNNARAIQLGICDEWETLAASLSQGARDREAATRSLEAVGSRLLLRVGTSSSFSAQRHDGIDAYRFLRWDAACGCMGYGRDLHRAL